MAKKELTLIILSCLIIVVFSQDSLGPCTCDLTANLCDLDCCCDPDCSLEDKLTFSTCISTYKYENALACSQAAVLYRNYVPYTSNTSSGNFFCIYFDRYTSRNYFVTPSVDASSAASVQSSISTYATPYSFGAVTSNLDPASVRTTYKTNVPVQVHYTDSNITGFLPQPRASNSPVCSYASPALFLDSSTSECARQVTNASCSSDSAISIASFVVGFTVARQPTVLDLAQPASRDLVNLVQVSVDCRDANGASVNCTDYVPIPALNDSYCTNVLSQLTYSIKYSSTTGIAEVSYSAVLRTVPVATAYNLKQTFTLSFSSATASTDAYPRSGNPGYLTGRPLIAGRINGQTIDVTPDPTKWVTLPGVNADGTCGDTTIAGQPVLFGENVRSSCIRNLTWSSAANALTTSCTALNAEIRASLVGLGINGTMALATFGNSSANQTGDWLSVIPEGCNPTTSASTTACTNIILGATLEVLVARAGSLSNPQNKLVGAKLKCNANAIIFQCAAGSCQAPSSTMKFLNSFTVSFIDVSGNPLEGAKQKPVYLLRLPTDFFYPLYSRAAGLLPLWQLLLLCLATVASACWSGSLHGAR